MPDGDPLIIGSQANTASSETRLTRDEVINRTVFVARNLKNGGGIRADAMTGVGLWGSSDSSYGAYASSSSGHGLRGDSRSGMGVFGYTAGTLPAILGENAGGPGGGAGVEGRSESIGVAGRSETGFGVSGFSRTAPGVRGESGSPSGWRRPACGVWGDSERFRGIVGSSHENTGVRGESHLSIGVFGEGALYGVGGRALGIFDGSPPLPGTRPRFAGVYGEGEVGVWAKTTGRSTGGPALPVAGYFEGPTAGVFWGDVNVFGGATVSGDFMVFGAKSAVVPHPDGTKRRLYSMESPEAWFEDFGRARLLEGTARVALDEDFAALIDADDYHVFLTPEGESAGLYVSERTREGFEVRESAGGIGDLPFSYRIIARRADVSVERLASVEPPPQPTRTSTVLDTLEPHEESSAS
jgi:hypothetical protein